MEFLWKTDYFTLMRTYGTSMRTYNWVVITLSGPQSYCVFMTKMWWSMLNPMVDNAGYSRSVI